MDEALKEIGEFGLIDRIKEDTINDAATVVQGIGDDAAILLPTIRHLQLLSTDMLVENVHFDLTTTTPWQLGYKAIAVNISDIAAMGGIPRHIVISLALPKDFGFDFVDNLYQGMKEICREFKVNIVGGDTVSSPHGLIINVAVVGEVEPACLTKRSGARPGDIVAVTGFLGNSGGGLAVLSQADWEEQGFAWSLVTRHLTPRPQVQAGQALARIGVSSMNDISDGLSSEANELAAASKVGIRLYKKAIPLSEDLLRAADWLGKSALDYALYGGEDYQLIFTVSPEKVGRLNKANLGVCFSNIGEVIEGSGVVLVDADGAEEKLEPKGYNHFR
ncbi:MAG: thiamine-phosphate kinase [Pelosinus sp.]|nr:thiamine-phosphate kinase [Pelosinus sp.]